MRVYDVFFKGDNDPPTACFFKESGLLAFLQGLANGNAYPDGTPFAITIDPHHDSNMPYYVGSHAGRYVKQGGAIEIVSETGEAVNLLKKIGFVSEK